MCPLNGLTMATETAVAPVLFPLVAIAYFKGNTYRISTLVS